jgi:hypothetical protein
MTDAHVVITGPISGTVTTADGTTYDVSADQIQVAEQHRQEVADLIGDRYATEGHPTHLYSDVPFSTAGSTAVTHFGTYSASTAGTYALGGALTSGVTAASITIAAGALSITIT